MSGDALVPGHSYRRGGLSSGGIAAPAVESKASRRRRGEGDHRPCKIPLGRLGRAQANCPAGGRINGNREGISWWWWCTGGKDPGVVGSQRITRGVLRPGGDGGSIGGVKCQVSIGVKGGHLCSRIIAHRSSYRGGISNYSKGSSVDTCDIHVLAEGGGDIGVYSYIGGTGSGEGAHHFRDDILDLLYNNRPTDILWQNGDRQPSSIRQLHWRLAFNRVLKDDISFSRCFALKGDGRQNLAVRADRYRRSGG
ncbi:MAG: hypothetical protein DDT30_02062 [Dehalococcoidia bacterium]|nr:hypothetical protein [Bacillota bacterium]